jgi:hypothetical protein
VGERYTYRDGVEDRAERDRVDAWLQAQIDDLYSLLGAKYNLDSAELDE